MLQEHDPMVQQLSTRSEPEPESPAQIVCARSGRIESVNEAWSSLLGYTLDRSPSLFDAALYADGEAGVLSLLDALEHSVGPMASLEMRLRHQDGSVVIAQVQCVATVLAGTTWFTAWIKPAAQDPLLHKLMAGAVIFGDGKVLRANETFAHMLGFEDAGSLAGHEVESLFEDDAEYERFGKESARSFEHGDTSSVTWRARHRDGSALQVYARGRKVQMSGLDQVVVWTIDDESDLRRAQEARQDNETYSRMLQDSHIAMSIYDPLADAYTDCNEAARKLYGVARREDLLGHNVLSVSAPFQENGASSAQMLAAGRKRLQSRGEEMPTFEWLHRRPNGVEWMAEVHGTPFRYRGRTLVQFTVSDITAAKKARREVGEMAVFLQTMIDRMPNAVFYLGPDSRLLGCNHAFEEAFGIRREELVGKRVDEHSYLTEAERAMLQAQHERVIANSSHERRETRLKYADGKMHQVLHSVSGFRRPDGSPGGLVGITVDLEALKAAENALGVAQREQVAMFETAGVGIAFVHDGVIRRCNRELEAMFGYGAGELQAQDMRIWYGSEVDSGPLRDELIARIGMPRDSHHDQQFVRKDGEHFWCRITARYIDTDTTQGSVWFMEDVTQERAIALALADAKQAAEESVQAKSMFLANMSHEIRTPMNAIIGLSMLALRTELNPRQRDYVAKVHNAGTALLGIINDILDFSKVEAGKLDIEATPFR
ncbi:PAS domain S-box protein, partial [Paucibacter sp. R3-3]